MLPSLPTGPGDAEPSQQRTRTDVKPPRRRPVLSMVALTLALAACEADPPRPSADGGSAPPASSPSTTAVDLSAIGCATDDPTGVGELTGAWAGSEGGVYYIRQVGDCVWWFGTDVDDIEPGQTGQFGFANVASGRMVGSRLDLEYADLPLGDTLGGGGLTFLYDEQNDQLTLTEQRGEWDPFGGEVLTRMELPASPDPSPSASARP